jgi:hypothetical protein
MLCHAYNDSIDDGKPQARALTGLIGAEERLKDPAEKLPTHPGSGVGDRQAYKASRPYI